MQYAGKGYAKTCTLISVSMSLATKLHHQYFQLHPAPTVPAETVHVKESYGWQDLWCVLTQYPPLVSA